MKNENKNTSKKQHDVKEVKMETKKEKGNFIKKIIDAKYIIGGFALGLVLGLGIMSAMMPEQIAKLKDGSESVAVFGDEGISADDLFSSLKSKATIESVLQLVDAKLLEEKYPYATYNEDAKKEATDMITYYSENYQMTEADFLSYYGFSDYDSFVEFLTLDTQRYDYFHDVLADKISDKDIKNYYKKNVYGAIGSQHVSVAIDEKSKDDEKLIKEIQNKVNKGATFEEIKEEYKDNSSVTAADLGYIAFDSGIEEKYEKALKKLKKNSHSEKYIETESFGYTIIFRTDQKEKEELKDIDSTIEELLIQNMISEDQNLFEKTLINLRKEAGLKFTDTNFGEAYKEFKKQYK